MYNHFSNTLTIFLGLLVEAIPFLLLGVIFSGVLMLFVPQGRLVAILPKHPALGALCGSMGGFLFPVCECGNVPVARRLLFQGAPVSVALGFLLAAPTVNPIVLWATWTAFRDQPEIVLLRLGFSVGITTAIAWLFSVLGSPQQLLQPDLARQQPKPIPLGTYWLGEKVPLQAPPLPWPQRWRQLGQTMGQEVQELGGVMVLGALGAALVQEFIPREWILHLGQGPVSSVVAMMVLATVVSMCSTVDAFFALSFASTFTSGSLLAFLVFGPMIDLKAMGLMVSIFPPRLVFYMFVLAAQLTFLLTVFLNLYVI